MKSKGDDDITTQYYDELCNHNTGCNLLATQYISYVSSQPNLLYRGGVWCRRLVCCPCKFGKVQMVIVPCSLSFFMFVSKLTRFTSYFPLKIFFTDYHKVVVLTSSDFDLV